MRPKSMWLLVSACFAVFLFRPAPSALAQSSSGIVVFSEAGFPAADSAAPSQTQLAALLPSAEFDPENKLHDLLAETSTRLLVLPYGSAYPEAAWPDIEGFLQRGGNLLVLGGRPFTRAAYHDGTGWHLREYSVRDTLPLLIDQYQETPGSIGLDFETNPDVVLKLSPFQWQRAFSPIIHLTSSDVYDRQGSAGRIEAHLETLAWGTRDGHRLSAPAIQVDHVRNRFAGGRWVFLEAELAANFYSGAGAGKIVPALAEEAEEGAQEFIVSPVLPLYLPGEPVELQVSWHGATKPEADLTARITLSSDQSPEQKTVRTVKIPAYEPLVLPSPTAGGLHTITAELLDGQKAIAIYHSGFWIRDTAYLLSGPRLSVNKNYFEVNGHPLAVVGTTYMASDVQRLYFDHPNVYVWNSDLGQISGDGLNMIRTGWWTGWDKFCDEEGHPYERTLRTLEAFLMTARKNGLPVQFNFFAFLPDVLGGENAYLDPQAVRRERNLISSVVQHFHDVPFFAWDLINEPSFSKHTWQMLPNGDPFELMAWNRWLDNRYPDRAALGAAWNFPSISAQGTIPLPTEAEFAPLGMYSGNNSLKLYDFFLFAQETFANWVKTMRTAIRSTGSEQPITIGQDEGGYDDRLTPAFFGPYVDFTTNHSWWDNDNLLWDSLVAKQPGLPMLIQETGIQRELTLDEIARRTPQSDADLLERKIAMSFVEGSGAVQWLWNTNDYMTASNEVPIGVLRADFTEKPEGAVMENFAKFSQDAENALVNPEMPPVAIVTSQAAQFSAIREIQVAAQRNAVRAIAYDSRTPAYVITENQIAKLGSPKLAILPSPQALSESAWQALLAYVKGGGNLLITGPVERDTHWHFVDRAADLSVNVTLEPLTVHNSEILMNVNGHPIHLAFDQQAQSWLESLQFEGGKQFQDIPYGKGRVFWAAYPVELAEGEKAAGELYTAVLNEIGVQPSFELKSSVSAGVLIYPTVLQDDVLYVMESETDKDTDLDLRDRLTGAELKLRLPAERAALAVIRKSDGAIIAKYGF